MRILYASERPPYPLFLGGAARCAHRLLVSLSADLGVECLGLGSSAYAVTPWSFPTPADFAALGVSSISAAPLAGGAMPREGTVNCGYPVRVVPDFPGALAQCIDDFRPNVIWSQLDGAQAVLAIARKKGVPGLLYVHDAEDDPKQLRATADLGCHVVCSSAFLARKVEAIIGRKAHTIYPASDWYFGTAGDAAGWVTMINAHVVKGLGTFLDIARRMPEQSFLLQESWKLSDTAFAKLNEQLAAVPNVRFQRRVPDMRNVYAQTRLLLVPSVWEEGFGMVAVEAQSCGIPVVASARGGLAESVGSGGLLIDDYRNPAAWVSAIGSVLGTDKAYRGWSELALAHARSTDFVPQQLARRLLAVCAGPAPHMGAYARGLRALSQGLGRLPLLGKLVQGEGP